MSRMSNIITNRRQASRHYANAPLHCSCCAALPTTSSKAPYEKHGSAGASVMMSAKPSSVRRAADGILRGPGSTTLDRRAAAYTTHAGHRFASARAVRQTENNPEKTTANRVPAGGHVAILNAIFGKEHVLEYRNFRLAAGLPGEPNPPQTPSPRALVVGLRPPPRTPPPAFGRRILNFFWVGSRWI